MAFNVQRRSAFIKKRNEKKEMWEYDRIIVALMKFVL